jgi:transposase
VLIARLVAQLHCYVPERADETWAQLRQLGARRERLVTEATACVAQLRDLLECVWPGVLEAAAKPFARPIGVPQWRWCWTAATAIPQRLARLGLGRFEAAVVRELPRWGGTRRRRAIIEAVYCALVDPRG